MLISAAAKAWGVPAAQVSTENGLLKAGSRTAGYGEFAEAAMAGEVPATVTLKSNDTFRYIGHGVGRLDSRDKSTGKQAFGIDASRPGMKTVLIARPPTFGGKVASFDDQQARAVRGVEHVMTVELDRGATGVAVVATGYWPAKQGRDALKVQWAEPGTKPDSEVLDKLFTELLNKPGLMAREADTSAIDSAAKQVSAQYHFPYLAHAPMEPLNALIEVTGNGESAHCTVWTGTQFQTFDQMAVARVLGLKPEQVTIETQFAGGGFGRRATPTSDYLADTASVMKAWLAAGRTEPLKLVWSREDDVRGGYYRPLTMHRAIVGIDANGNVVGWDHRIVSQSILTGTAFESFFVKDGVDHSAVEGVSDTSYDLPINVSVHHPVVDVPVLWWRSVGQTHSAYVMETLIDQVAAASGQTPLAMRRRLLASRPRHLAALDLVVEQSGYGSAALPKGRAHGLAVHASFDSVVAHVAEVSVVDGKPGVHRVTSAIHCNTAVNPESVKAQVEGSVLMAVGTILDGSAITLKDGVVSQSNFHDYTVARMPDMPDISVHIVPSSEPPTGVGEPGLPPAAPAIANAVFALTGNMPTSLPFSAV